MKLVQIAREVNQDIPEDIEINRVIYDSFENVVYFVEQQDYAKTWAIHAIPLKWNNTSIDCIQIYCVKGQVTWIGNSITVQTAQEHSKSLRWIQTLDIDDIERMQKKTFVLFYFLLAGRF
eukprot:m.345315 g.345315  ORF g.345315 m.345315 type:complete len:120 (-) comp26104_c0_seq1:552-911(-)